MLKDVVAVQPLPDHHLRVTFDDGVEGIVNVCELVQFTGVFQPLQDASFFEQVKVNPGARDRLLAPMMPISIQTYFTPRSRVDRFRSTSPRRSDGRLPAGPARQVRLTGLKRLTSRRKRLNGGQSPRPIAVAPIWR